MSIPDSKSTLPHFSMFFYSVSEVERLVEIHGQISGSGPGRRVNLEVLNKSAIVLLVAAWEAFIEELAKTAFDFLMAEASSPNVFPNKVLALAGRDLRSSRDETKIWDLAGTGWESVLRKHRRAILDRYTGSFNTPRARQVDALFEAMIGLRSASGRWHWPGMSSQKVVRKLDNLVTLRGSIRTGQAPVKLKASGRALS